NRRQKKKTDRELGLTPAFAARSQLERHPEKRHTLARNQVYGRFVASHSFPGEYSQRGAQAPLCDRSRVNREEVLYQDLCLASHQRLQWLIRHRWYDEL